MGAADTISLADVRALARDYRQLAKDGIDPRRSSEEPVESGHKFIDCMNEYIATKEKAWKSPAHRRQWHMTLNEYAAPLHDLDVQDIKPTDIVSILEPMWLSKYETASRLRGRIEAVLDYAKAKGWREGENPAVWRGNLRILLPTYSKARNVKHHPALPYEDIPEFMPYLRQRKATTASLLEFIILTATRSGEARNAKFSEIDVKNKTWTIPADRMKMGKEHVIPLSDRALAIVIEQAEFRQSDLIFENFNTRKAFDWNGPRMLLKRMDCGHITTHGFRSTFRDWAGDKTNHQRETIEAALAHSLQNRVEAAYRRSSALEKRRVLMQDWADFCGTSHNHLKP